MCVYMYVCMSTHTQNYMRYVVALHEKSFPVSEVLIISIIIKLFGCIFVALGFFAVSHYQSANAARADVSSLAPHEEAGKLRLLLIQWESGAAFYDLITADVNFTMVTKRGRLQRGLAITALALG